MTKPDIYACLYVQEFPTQAILRLRPDLHKQPCVVMEGEAPLQQVCSLNRKARAIGLLPAMTQVEVDTFPRISVLRRSRNQEAATKEILLECAGAVSPRVEERSEGGAFLCVLDITGTQGLFGSTKALAQGLHARIIALGITASVAVSGSFHATVALAKGLSSQSIQVVTVGEEAAALAPLPLEVLNLTEDQAETFALWGIRTLGMLAALPEKELISRMGQAGKRLLQLARGERPHLFQPFEPPVTLTERMELESPVEALDALMFVVNLMLEQLILRATARVLALASITMALTMEGGVTHVRTVRPALPANDRRLWIKLLHLDLEAHPPQAAILTVALKAEPGSTSKMQLGLFSPQLPEPSRLDVTLARIRAIVGEENVGRAILEDTHRPDGFRLEPFRVSSSRTSAIASPPRPARRKLRPPEAVFITLQSERPETFVFREQHYTVERAYGPWLTSGDWWCPTMWGYEQWDLVGRARNGAILCCCLIRDILREQWQMAALYD